MKIKVYKLRIVVNLYGHCAWVAERTLSTALPNPPGKPNGVNTRTILSL